MASLPMYDQHGAEIGKYDIDPSQIAERINKQLLHDAVVMYQANQRQGTRQTKSRGEVAGSTKKMYRQKGTGRARAGSRRTNIRRGGGHAFALRTRDYSYRLPRKALRLATRMAIAGKIQGGQVAVVDRLEVTEPKTKPIAKMLQAMGLDGVTTLIATERYDSNLYRSARNIAGVTVSPVGDLNAWLVLGPRRVVFTRAALDKLRGEPSHRN